MFLCSVRPAVFLLGLVFFYACGNAQENQTDAPTLWPLPLPSVQIFAATHQIPLRGFSKTENRRSQIHDKSTVLISSGEGPTLKQWIVEIEAMGLTPTEQSHQEPAMPLYVSTGRTLFFRTQPLALTLKTHGPFTATPQKQEVETRTSRVIVNEENLRLGFDQACQACVRIIALKRARGETGNIGLSFRGTPFTTVENETSQSIAREVALTPQEERALAGSVPALSSFFEIAQGAPALKEVMERIITLPSAWSIIVRGGKLDTKILLNAKKIAPIKLDELPGDAFVLPITLEINGRSSLECALCVAQPQPPFLLTAGIFRMSAQAPTRPEQHATLQLLSATCGQDSSP